MKEFHGKVAVITGAASGFGCEFAIRCADEGMKVILTDIDTGGLGTTVALLKPGTESLVIGTRRCIPPSDQTRSCRAGGAGNRIRGARRDRQRARLAARRCPSWRFYWSSLPHFLGCLSWPTRSSMIYVKEGFLPSNAK